MNQAGSIRRVVLLRHGETIAAAGTLLGRSDPPLSEEGVQQVRRALARIDAWGPPLDRVITSPRQRCRLSAQAFAASRQLPFDIGPDWAELDFGAWDGMHLSDLPATEQARYQHWRDDPTQEGPPGGERFDTLRQRLTQALASIPAAPRTLVLTHAGVIRTLLADVLRLPWGSVSQIALPHAGWVELSLYGKARPYLIGLGAPEPEP